MADPVAILTRALSDRGLAYVTAHEMTSILRELGLTISGGARQNAEEHLTTHCAAGADYVLKQLTPRTS